MAHVLIIDDDAPLRGMLAEILRTAGHTTEEAADGVEGAQRYRANPADVVLCDIVMKQSGLTLIRILTEQYPNARIIAISGVDRIRLAHARGCGAMRTLRKPFSPTELIDMVAEVLAAEPGAQPPEPAAGTPTGS
jgi:CheY-like chemotaxis protein